MTTPNTKEELYLNGIYSIYCISNNKFYIGSASGTNSYYKYKNGFIARFNDHKYKLNNNKHKNSYLQNAYNMYGSENFIFEIVEICDTDKCKLIEIPYMDKYQSMIYQNGFNIIRQSLSNHSGYFSKEHKRKISESLLGIPRTLELKKKLGTSIGQYDLDNNFITEYYSMSEASRITGIQRQDIGQSIIGIKCKTAGGFIWKKMKT